MDCAGCHIARFDRSDIIKRYSLEFNHDSKREKIDKDASGVETKIITYNHDKECTTCHVRITQSADLSSLKPEVPIFTCATTCHNPELKGGMRDGNKIKGEINQREDKEIQSCSYCHSIHIGSLPIPQSHMDVK